MEEREREAVLRIWRRFPFLCVPLRVWEYTLGWPFLKGTRSSSYFYMFSCPIKERKREAIFMYVERLGYLWVLLRFGNTIKWCFLRRTDSYGNLPYNIICSGPLLVGAT
jgi:hypothetical protein